MSNRTAFFNALTEELPDDVWGLRLQQELAAHLEDAIYFDALQGKSEAIAEEQALTDLGSPTLILQEFRHAMTYKSPQAFILHAVGVGLAVSPLLFVLTLFLRVSPISGVFVLALAGLYIVLLSPILRHIESVPLEKTIFRIAAGVPLIIVTAPLSFALLSTPRSLQDLSVPFYMFTLGILGGVINILCARYAVHFIRQRQATAKNTQKNVDTSSSNATRIVAILLIGWITTATTLERFPVSSLAAIPKLQWMINTVLTATNAMSDVASPSIGIYITGIIVGGLGIIGTIFIAQWTVDRSKRRANPFPWLWLVTMVYAATLIIVPSPIYQRHLDVAWSNIPHQNISAALEQKELGPFYRMAKYLNQNSQNIFRYHVSNPDLGKTLEIQQYPDHVFTLANIQSVDSYDIAKRIEDTDNFDSTMTTANIWCHWVDHPEIMTSDPEMVTGQKVFLMNLSPMFCSDLYVGDKKVFDAPQGIDIGRDASITVSTDEKWLLFAHDTDTDLRGSFTPTEVYLVDLR